MVLRRLRRTNRPAGFTLLEIMVALAIFALAASVLMVTDGRAIRQTARVQDKIQASWLADQALNRYYGEEIWPDIGRRSNTATLAGKNWTLKNTVTSTSQDGLRKVVIDVFTTESSKDKRAAPIHSLTGYVRRFSK